MKDHGISLNQKCPCVQLDCSILGNCVLCVQNHLEHNRHIPECFQNILRPAVESLARQMEFKTAEGRPESGSRSKEHKDRILLESIARHRKPK
jgi:hypothetical protein